MSDSVNAIRRRILLAGTSGAALSIYPALIPSAFGKAPMAGSQAISVHRMKLGNFEITAMLDGFIDIPPGVLQADPELVKTLLTAGGWPPAPMRLPVNTFLVNTGEKLVLLDAGGAKMLGPTAGRLPQCLAAAGIEPGQIDEVYITHMHGDHLHGTVTPEGTAMFPNATLRIAKADMDYWTSPEVEAKAPENQKARFIPVLPRAGLYQVAITYSALANRAANVPVTIHHADGDATVIVDQKKKPAGKKGLHLLGTYRFEVGKTGWVEITNTGTRGHVIIDAVQFLAE